MIKVKVIKDSKGFIWQFVITGHAGFAENGRDIVCAAVSAIAYTALGALEELTGIRNYSEKDGYIKCSIPIDIDDEKKQTVKIILQTMVIGLKQIEYSYGDFMVVTNEEV